jgi:hypothetical protein
MLRGVVVKNENTNSTRVYISMYTAHIYNRNILEEKTKDEEESIIKTKS